jgi:hypothetical protein
MNKVLFVLPLLVAVAYAQINAFAVNSSPTLVVPGAIYTSSYNDSVISYIGSQFYFYVPKNASRIHIDWVRSATDSGCPSNAFAYLYAKWGSFPCYSGSYSGIDQLCDENYVYFSYSTGSVVSITLDAYDSDGLQYWYSAPSDDDFIVGDYLFLSSYVDIANQNCSASLNISFDYCPSGQIVAESDSLDDSQCVTYTNATSSFSESVVINGTFQKFYVVNVPVNASGVWVGITTYNYSDSVLLYVYGRYSSGAVEYNDYGSTGGYGNLSIWFPNLPAGDFVITVEDEYTETNVQFDIQIQVRTCPPGYASDEDGNCNFPYNITSWAALSAAPLSVTIPQSNYSSDCNWRFYGFAVPAFTYAYFNLTLTETVGTAGTAYLRRNAWPTKSYYDDYVSSNDVINFTPEEFYVPTTTWFYLGFCNDGTSESSTWTVSGSFSSAGPSPSSTPSPIPASASPSPGPDDGSSAPAIFFSVFVTLAALLLTF